MPTVLWPRKTIGAFEIYERKPKPHGVSKYVVFKGAEQMQDFSRYALAVLWCKKQSPREVPKVVIDIETKTAVSTVPLDCTFIDGPHRHTTNAVVDPDRIEEILKATATTTT